MSKKKRFRKKALGRIKMFFQAVPYSGYANIVTLKKTSNTTYIFEKNVSNLNHYKDVTKKKTHYVYN